MRALPRHIHLTAVGGVGMASLAGLFTLRGARVTGSDANVYPPMSDVLRDAGVEVREGYRPENLADTPDLVVVGNAVSRSNPEIGEMLRRGLPHMSMPQALWEFFLSDRTRLVVAGTHGKTTTSSLLSWVLESAGQDPSFLVGGVPKNFSRGYRLGGGPHMVVEGDEYDTAFFDKGPKFLHYRPQYTILTSVEFDHADIYRDLDHVKQSFRSLLATMPGDGYLAVSADYPHALEVSAGAAPATETYSVGGSADWRVDGGRVFHGARCLGEWALPSTLPGRHNAMNALGVTALAFRLGISFAAITQGLATFAGIRRRQEAVGEAGGVAIVDDFAHHPTAIRETIAAIRGRYPGRRLWAVFEPRSNTSRRNTFQAEVGRALAGADAVIVAGVYNAEKIDPRSRFSPEKAVEDVAAAGVPAACVPDAGAILERLREEIRPGDVVLFMSNAAFENLPRRLLSALGG